MKKVLVNKVHVEGVLYEYDLNIKQTGETSKNPGTEFISGEIRVATDEAMKNIIPVHFTYETAIFSKSKKENTRFTILKKIIDGEFKSFMESPEEAIKLRIDSNLSLNDFFVEDNGEEVLRSPIRIESGFMHVTPSLNDDEGERCKFTLDVVLDRVYTKTTTNPVTEEETEKSYIHGYAFDDYRKMALPVDLKIIDNPGAIAYFENLEPSVNNLVFTQVAGKLNYTNEVIPVENKGAFSTSVGQKYVRTRDWVIDWAMQEPYPEFDEENAAMLGMTREEWVKACTARNTYVAEVKARNDEYKARKAAENNALTATSNVVPMGAYNIDNF